MRLWDEIHVLMASDFQRFGNGMYRNSRGLLYLLRLVVDSFGDASDVAYDSDE